MAALLAGIAGLLLGALLGAVWAARRRAASGRADGQDPADEQTRRLAEAGGRLAKVAHELRNPLTAILAFAEDLLRAEPNLEQREALLVIRHQAKRSRLILSGVLDTVRGVPSAPAKRTVDVAALIVRVGAVVDREARVRGVKFEQVVAGDLPVVQGEEPELEQVLTNLLQNAVQATPRGGLVSLAARARGRLLEFVVRDTGPGIPSDVLPRIFEPFYTTKPAGEGTGLGLTIVQEIVRRHRGILTAENMPSSDGGGARFVVVMPFEDRRWRDREVAADELPPRRQQVSAARRLLLVEDEVTVRQAVRRFLERLGWEVTEAGDGRAALAGMLPEGGPCIYDAIVCDLRLPGVSGMALYERVVAEAPELRQRLVLVSGDLTSEDVRGFLQRTGAAVLEKPYELEVLAGALERLPRPQ